MVMLKMYDIVENALVLPAIDGDFVGDGRSAHGVFLPLDPGSGNANYSHMRGGESWRNVNLQNKIVKENPPKKKIKGTWLYAGIYLSPFGHFLSESIHRLWFLLSDTDVKVDGVIFNVSVHQKGLCLDECPSYVKDVLSFYLNNLPVIFINDTVEFERIIIPHPGSQLGIGREEWYSNLPVSFFYESSVRFSERSPRKVIIARRRYYDKGRVLGIDYFWKLLEKDGFIVVNPEDHSVSRQVEIIKRAEIVLWEEGSAMHILELMKESRAVHCLVSRRECEKNGKYSLDSFLSRSVPNSCSFSFVCQLASPGVPSHNQASVLKCPNVFFQFLLDNFDVSLKGYNAGDFYRNEYLSLKKLAVSKNITRDYLCEASFQLGILRA